MDSLFALVSWQIWKEQNTRGFRNGSTAISDFLPLIKAKADRWIEAGATGLRRLAER
jgi:hypothetical protein